MHARAGRGRGGDGYSEGRGGGVGTVTVHGASDGAGGGDTVDTVHGAGSGGDGGEGGKNPGRLSLLSARRFLPFFVTQLLGAFNDNLFKSALLLLVAFHVGSALDINFLVNLSAALFILPFFLFSALAGQLAERSDKAAYIRRLKLLEIAIMLIASLGFFLSHIPLLMTALFLTGLQSALFGPVKYSILPQQLSADELTDGNALVECGTFMAILLGTLVGGVLIAVGGGASGGAFLLSASVLAVAGCGWLASCFIPTTIASAPGLKLRWNLFAESVRILGYLRAQSVLLFAVLGISWFWFYGALFLTQLPNYTRVVLGGDGSVATILLCAFTLGIGSGALLCARLSGGKLEPGLVPLGAIGMTVFALDLGFAQPGLAVIASTSAVAPTVQLLSGADFLSTLAHWRILADLSLIALSGGLYIVPLYTFVQHHCEDAHRSRVIAANNILNAAFLVGAAMFAIVLLSAGLSIPRLFQITALVNALALLLLCWAWPEISQRCVAWLKVRLGLAHAMHK